MRCPVRGHDHDLEVQRTMTQQGTNDKATMYECPSNQTRFFVRDADLTISPMRTFKRPRWGWKS
jgi:hypothetical protein